MTMDYNPIPIKGTGKDLIPKSAKIARIRLHRDHGILVRDPKAQYTIVTIVIEEIARTLATEFNLNGTPMVVHIDKFIEASTNFSERDGEMEGNLVPSLKAGEDFDKYINGEMGEPEEGNDEGKKYPFNPITFNQDEREFWMKVAHNSSIRLNEERGIALKEPHAMYTILVVFLQEIARQLGNEIRSCDSNSRIDIYETIQLGGVISNDKIVPEIVAGKNFKLYTKNNDKTESEEED